MKYLINFEHYREWKKLITLQDFYSAFFIINDDNLGKKRDYFCLNYEIKRWKLKKFCELFRWGCNLLGKLVVFRVIWILWVLGIDLSLMRTFQKLCRKFPFLFLKNESSNYPKTTNINNALYISLIRLNEFVKNKNKI
jgi:hypothetical protein